MRRFIHFPRHEIEDSASPSTSNRRNPILCSNTKARASATNESATFRTR
ncbi:hypothetical protein ES288_D08G063300v1 [Gossypium darwinii]|uniref:Uncharacterized protein n=2 Tax=Gossypium TaxID=3633 RepID=A0A5D2JSZ7_GOSTO|nr:hypothetical protein ES288_D08G063300v1 [Gossypium darwinii]TYH57033.1 hypothetical protein ES332_D08G061900v1 [Gossypium tomentosum]